jgi:hypothetical protein
MIKPDKIVEEHYAQVSQLQKGTTVSDNMTMRCQTIQQWKHNRFETYKKNNRDTAIHNLTAGTNGEAATMQMLQTINSNKEEVTKFCYDSCVSMWLDAADVCNLTYLDPFRTNTRLSCRQPIDIKRAWQQCAGPENCKWMAFIFDYCGTVIYPRALNKTQQAVTTDNLLATMGIEFDVRPNEMQGGQKTCVEQQHSYTAKNTKNNILRGGGDKHKTRVNLERGKGATNNKNRKRPKQVFFISRMNTNLTGEKVVEEVSRTKRIMGMVVFCQ